MIKNLVSIGAVLAVLFAVLFGVYDYFQTKSRQEWNAWTDKVNKEKMAWQEPIVENCKNAVRAIADKNTLRFESYYSDYDFQNTEGGYSFRISAADATSNNQFVTFTCYTDKAGKVFDLVVKKY